MYVKKKITLQDVEKSDINDAFEYALRNFSKDETAVHGLALGIMQDVKEYLFICDEYEDYDED